MIHHRRGRAGRKPRAVITIYRFCGAAIPEDQGALSSSPSVASRSAEVRRLPQSISSRHSASQLSVVDAHVRVRAGRDARSGKTAGCVRGVQIDDR